MKNIRHYWLPLLLAIALTPAVGCGKKKKTIGAAAPSVPVITVRAQDVAARTFERRLTVQGTLEAKYFANVAARADGNLEEIWWTRATMSKPAKPSSSRWMPPTGKIR